MKHLLAASCYVVGILLFSLSMGQAQPPKQEYGRGHKTPANIKQLVAKSFENHGKKLAGLPRVTAPAYDCRMLGIVGPVKNQGQCGSCYIFSATEVVESAQFQVGNAKNDNTFSLSTQYSLDCGSNAGCDGGDEYQICKWAMNVGIPSTADYGPYTANPAQCRLKPNSKMYTISAMGFCTNNQGGVANTQDIKDCLVKFGPISVAVDARAFNSYNGGVMRGTGHSIDHAVVIVGWKDDTAVPEGGYWFVMNSWSTSWGEQGYCRMAYGAYDIGTEAIWTQATGTDPPVPPTPPGPQPPSNNYTFTIPGQTIPGQTIIIPGGFFSRGITIKTAPYTLPAQTITFPK